MNPEEQAIANLDRTLRAENAKPMLRTPIDAVLGAAGMVGGAAAGVLGKLPQMAAGPQSVTIPIPV